MNDFWQTVGPALAAFAGFFGWKGAAFFVAGMWFGDFAGRRWPDAWQWLRAGAKKAGDTASDAVKS